MIGRIFLCIFVLNLLGCKVYCYARKKRAEKRKEACERFEGTHKIPTQMGNGSLLAGMIDKCCLILDSVLRLDLWIVGMFPCHLVRNFIYRHICYMKIDRTATIYYGAEIRAPWNISIGAGSVIGDRAILDGRCGIEIGNNVNFSSGVWIWTMQHDIQSPLFETQNQGGRVKIGDRAWISCRTVILPGVEIGTGSVVAAGAVVTKDCDSFTIYGGIPARVMGKRNTNLTYENLGSRMWFL